MDRWASGIDTAWLQLEQPTNRMVVHGILFCEGPVDIAALRERVRERWVAVYPGLRQRPTWPASGLGPVRWVDHEPDLGAHIDTVALAAPGDDDALARHVGELMSRPLPEDRPWWAIHVLTGWAGEGTAVVVSIHHGLADGVALNHLFHALADGAPGTEEGTPAAYAAPPKRRHGVRDVRLVRREVPQRLRRLTRTVAGSSRPGGARELAATGRAIGRSTALIARPPTPRPRCRAASARRRRRAGAGAWTSTWSSGPARSTAGASTTCCAPRSRARCGRSSARTPRACAR